MSQTRETERSRASIGATRSAESHDAILTAAKALLAERGYAGFSMEAVARLARASKPTIYRRWPNKAALIVELYDLASETVVDVGDLGSCDAELSALIRKTWSFWRDTMAGSIMRSIIAEAQGSPVALAQLRDEFIPARRRFARAIIERGIARGEICREVDVESLIDILYGYAWYNLLTDRIGPEDYERAEATIVAIVTGLRPRRKAEEI